MYNIFIYIFICLHIYSPAMKHSDKITEKKRKKLRYY